MAIKGTKGADAFDLSDFIERDRPITLFLSTGSTLLDLAIAGQIPGGVASGRITHIFGDSSTAKSALSTSILGSVQRQGGGCVLDDVEGTWDSVFGSYFGVNSKDEKLWRRIASASIEELFDIHLPAVVKFSESFKNKASAMVIDTLSALPSEEERESKLGDSTYGTSRAKQLSKAFRKTIDTLNKTKNPLALIFVDQTRTNLGVMFGSSKTVSGGLALPFYSSTRIFLKHLGKLKNKNDAVVGIKVGFDIIKNKVSVPFREGTFRLLFDYGIDDVASSLEWLHEKDPDQTSTAKKSRKWQFKDISARGLNTLAGKVEEAKLEAEVKEKVVKVWNIIHKSSERILDEQREETST